MGDVVLPLKPTEEAEGGFAVVVDPARGDALGLLGEKLPDDLLRDKLGIMGALVGREAGERTQALPLPLDGGGAQIPEGTVVQVLIDGGPKLGSAAPRGRPNGASEVPPPVRKRAEPCEASEVARPFSAESRNGRKRENGPRSGLWGHLGTVGSAGPLRSNVQSARAPLQAQVEVADEGEADTRRTIGGKCRHCRHGVTRPEECSFGDDANGHGGPRRRATAVTHTQAAVPTDAQVYLRTAKRDSGRTYRLRMGWRVSL